MAFEDLIFRLKVQGGDLTASISKAINSAQKKARVKVPLDLDTRGLGDKVQKALDGRTYTITLQTQISSAAAKQAQKAAGEVSKRAARERARASKSAQQQEKDGIRDSLQSIRRAQQIKKSLFRDEKRQRQEAAREAIRLAKQQSQAESRAARDRVREAKRAASEEAKLSAARLLRTRARERAVPLPVGERATGLGRQQFDRTSAKARAGVGFALDPTRDTRAFAAIARGADAARRAVRGFRADVRNLGVIALDRVLNRTGVSGRILARELRGASRVLRVIRAIASASARVFLVLGRAVRTAVGRTAVASMRALGAAVRSTTAGVRRLVSNFARLTAILSGGAFIGGGLLLPLAGIRAIQSALQKTAQFGDDVRKSITLFADELDRAGTGRFVDQVNDKFNELSDTVLRTAQSTGQSTSEIAGGLRQILSAGIGLTDTSQRMEAIQASSNVALGAVTSFDTAFRGLLALVRPFNISFGRAADLLFSIDKLGIAPVEQLAEQLGRVTPVASALGVDVDELAAAFSTTTSAGQKLTAVTTGLRQIFATFAKNGSGPARQTIEDLRRAFPQLNFALKASFIRTQGLSGLIRELSKVNQDAVGQIIRRTRALVPLLSLIQNQAKFESDLVRIRKSSGDAEKAAAVRLQGLQVSFNRLRVAVESFVIGVTDQIAKLIDLKSTVDSVIGRLNAFSNALRSISKEDFGNIVENLISEQGVNRVIEFVIRKVLNLVQVLALAFSRIAPLLARLAEPIAAVGTALARRFSNAFIGTLQASLSGIGSSSVIFSPLTNAAKSLQQFQFTPAELDPSKIINTKSFQDLSRVIQDGLEFAGKQAAAAVGPIQKELSDAFRQKFGFTLEEVIGKITSGGELERISKVLRDAGKAAEDAGASVKFLGELAERASLSASVELDIGGTAQTALETVQKQISETENRLRSLNAERQRQISLARKLGETDAEAGVGAFGLDEDIVKTRARVSSLKSLLRELSGLEPSAQLDLGRVLRTPSDQSLAPLRKLGDTVAKNILPAEKLTDSFVRSIIESAESASQVLDLSNLLGPLGAQGLGIINLQDIVTGAGSAEEKTKRFAAAVSILSKRNVPELNRQLKLLGRAAGTFLGAATTGNRVIDSALKKVSDQYKGAIDSAGKLKSAIDKVIAANKELADVGQSDVDTFFFSFADRFETLKAAFEGIGGLGLEPGEIAKLREATAKVTQNIQQKISVDTGNLPNAAEKIDSGATTFADAVQMFAEAAAGIGTFQDGIRNLQIGLGDTAGGAAGGLGRGARAAGRIGRAARAGARRIVAGPGDPRGPVGEAGVAGPAGPLRGGLSDRLGGARGGDMISGGIREAIDRLVPIINRNSQKNQSALDDLARRTDFGDKPLPAAGIDNAGRINRAMNDQMKELTKALRSDPIALPKALPGGPAAVEAQDPGGPRPPRFGGPVFVPQLELPRIAPDREAGGGGSGANALVTAVLSQVLPDIFSQFRAQEQRLREASNVTTEQNDRELIQGTRVSAAPLPFIPENVGEMIGELRRSSGIGGRVGLRSEGGLEAERGPLPEEARRVRQNATDISQLLNRAIIEQQTGGGRLSNLQDVLGRGLRDLVIGSGFGGEGVSDITKSLKPKSIAELQARQRVLEEEGEFGKASRVGVQIARQQALGGDDTSGTVSRLLQQISRFDQVAGTISADQQAGLLRGILEQINLLRGVGPGGEAAAGRLPGEDFQQRIQNIFGALGKDITPNITNALLSIGGIGKPSEEVSRVIGVVESIAKSTARSKGPGGIESQQLAAILTSLERRLGEVSGQAPRAFGPQNQQQIFNDNRMITLQNAPGADGTFIDFAMNNTSTARSTGR